MWVSDVPHFCGEDDCLHEGEYEIRLDVDDSMWTNGEGRDSVIDALNAWCSDPQPDSEEADWN